ncbi:MAG: hypothetical protein ACYS8Z_18885 [Planctomycetota bacterium]|jgi:hypothetical protein
MVELLQVFQDFERDAGLLAPLMLLGAGAIITIVGLIIWLGGSALVRLSLLILGTVLGLVFALTVVEVGLMPALLIGLLAGGSGALFNKPAIGVLTAVLVLAIVFCFLARPFIEAPRGDGSVGTADSKMYWNQSWVLVQSHAAGLDTAVSQVFRKMPKLYWAILAGAAAVGGILAMKLRRTATAFCFGTSGAMFVFAGIVLVLLQRSFAVISHVLEQPAFYAAVFGGSAVFGMCVQLIFCRHKKGVSGEGKDSGDGSEESSSGKKTWRTS